MGETVVFLGADSSKALGLPITADIFPMPIERLMSKSPSDEPLFGGDAIDR